MFPIKPDKRFALAPASLPQRPGLEEWGFRWQRTPLFTQRLLWTNNIDYKSVRTIYGHQSLVSLCLPGRTHPCFLFLPCENKINQKAESLRMRASESLAAHGMWVCAYDRGFTFRRELKSTEQSDTWKHEHCSCLEHFEMCFAAVWLTIPPHSYKVLRKSKFS